MNKDTSGDGASGDGASGNSASGDGASGDGLNKDTSGDSAPNENNPDDSASGDDSRHEKVKTLNINDNDINNIKRGLVNFDNNGNYILCILTLDDITITDVTEYFTLLTGLFSPNIFNFIAIIVGSTIYIDDISNWSYDYNDQGNVLIGFAGDIVARSETIRALLGEHREIDIIYGIGREIETKVVSTLTRKKNDIAFISYNNKSIHIYFNTKKYEIAPPNPIELENGTLSILPFKMVVLNEQPPININTLNNDNIQPIDSSISDTPGHIDYVIQHQKNRFELLDKILTDYEFVKVIIGGEDNVHKLGDALAVAPWNNVDPSKRSYERMKSNLNTLVYNLQKKYNNRIRIGTVGWGDISYPSAGKLFSKTRADNPSINLIHVWGANETNIDNINGSNIEGGGQANAFTKKKGVSVGQEWGQRIGVFGIVTMPTNDITKLESRYMDMYKKEYETALLTYNNEKKIKEKDSTSPDDKVNKKDNNQNNKLNFNSLLEATAEINELLKTNNSTVFLYYHRLHPIDGSKFNFQMVSTQHNLTLISQNNNDDNVIVKVTNFLSKSFGNNRPSYKKITPKVEFFHNKEIINIIKSNNNIFGYKYIKNTRTVSVYSEQVNTDIFNSNDIIFLNNEMEIPVFNTSEILQINSNPYSIYVKFNILELHYYITINERKTADTIDNSGTIVLLTLKSESNITGGGIVPKKSITNNHNELNVIIGKTPVDAIIFLINKYKIPEGYRTNMNKLRSRLLALNIKSKSGIRELLERINTRELLKMIPGKLIVLEKHTNPRCKCNMCTPIRKSQLENFAKIAQPIMENNAKYYENVTQLYEKLLSELRHSKRIK